jgi:serine/threonine protein kinase
MQVKLLFRCLGEAVCANGVRALAGALPLGQVAYEIAVHAWQRFRDEARHQELLAMLEEVAQISPAEVQREAGEAADAVAGDQPEQVRQQVAGYLAQVPAAIRQSLKRPTDPRGISLPPLLELNRPEDLLQFLPTRMPRFQVGDRPVGIGDWELEELLGVGGFGEVWKAHHVYFDAIAPVALKFCLDEEARDRLLKHEAAILNQVLRHGRHPGIVALLDASLSMTPPCLKYEYIEGGDLAGLVRDWQTEPHGPAFLDRANRVLWRLAEIVGYAHRLDPPIVHRDLKPANVLVQRAADGAYTLRVTDFGIGAVAALPSIQEASRGVTSRSDLLATALRGSHTPLYASPQQMRGEPPDPRDDVHALGVIWYQLLTRDLSSGAPTGLWAEDLEEAGLSRDLIRLLGACVASRPEKRPGDAAELAERLAEVLGSIPATKKAEPEPSSFEPRLQAFLDGTGMVGFYGILDLTNKRVGDEGIRALAHSPKLAELSQLILSGNLISDEGAEALAASPHARNLSTLILWDNRIGDRGVAALAGSAYLAGLNKIDVGKNLVGDEGVIALANSPHMAHLEVLILVSNFISDVGAQAIVSSPYLGNLAELKPLNNRISDAGASALKDRFGKRVRIY